MEKIQITISSPRVPSLNQVLSKELDIRFLLSNYVVKFDDSAYRGWVGNMVTKLKQFAFYFCD